MKLEGQRACWALGWNEGGQVSICLWCFSYPHESMISYNEGLVRMQANLILESPPLTPSTRAVYCRYCRSVLCVAGRCGGRCPWRCRGAP